MAARQQKKPATRRRRRKGGAAPEPLAPREVAAGAAAPAEIARLRERVAADGGAVIATYRDPYAGRWLLLAALPLERVEPTPYQRDVSAVHVGRLMEAITKTGLYADPILTVPAEGRYWTPNGGHRLQAMKDIGAKSIIALVLPDPEVAYRILALNTEKAHNLRERSLEAIRMARALAGESKRPEKDYAAVLEEAALVTLGICYEHNGRFGGGAYHPVLRRADEFLSEPLGRALEVRERRAALLEEIDTRVGEVVTELRKRGLVSPYLRSFVVARTNPLRFAKLGRGEKASFDATFSKMLAAVRRFDPGKIRTEDLARMGGPPPELEGGE